MTVWPPPVEAWSWPVRGSVIGAALDAFLLASAMMAPAAQEMRARALLGTLAGCLASRAGHRGWTGWPDVAVVALYATGAVAVCDPVENLALSRVVTRDHRHNYPRIATTASTVKWWLVAAVALTVATVALLFVAAPRR